MQLTVLDGSRSRAAEGCDAGGCGAAARPPRSACERIRDHPCYSEQAHRHYARMHVAVAPACNIQCHYCNRKFDCTNESRPGVVSELLSPDQAVRKVLAVAAEIPQLTVVGIAGPGDPLANPDRTFATLRALAQQAPDLKLCVSTNGLALPDRVDELCALGVDHVTLTINSVDPEVGARIHPWIFWKNRRIKGRRAAAILIEQQQRGLRRLAERGVLVKVNSVVIPGVNDDHVVEVSRVVRARGAFLHNVMPLIAAPEHGSFLGVMGQRGPTPAELRAIQDACGDEIEVMRHCHRCRADAVGLLGEDRNAEFPMDRIETRQVDRDAALRRRQAVRRAIEAGRWSRASGAGGAPAAAPGDRAPEGRARRAVRMAVATRSGAVVDQHFGHARGFRIYEATEAGVRFVGQRRVELYCAGDEACGDAEDRLEATIRALRGCEVMLCSRIGIAPARRLEEVGIQPNSEHALETNEDAVAAVYREMAHGGGLDAAPAAARALA